MCNLYTNDPTLIQWMEEFRTFLGLHLRLPARAAEGQSNMTYAREVYPKYQGLFARPIDPNDPGEGLEAAVGRWGIVPFFHKGPASGWKFPTNNCRSEEMVTKSSFRDAVKRRRCIIPATSFVEWTGPKGTKTKHTITRKDGSPLFFAGLWADHTWEGERTDSYTMVMQAAEEGCDMVPFHNRQPVVLSAETARTWLDLNADPMAVIRAPALGTFAFDPPEPVPA